MKLFLLNGKLVSLNELNLQLQQYHLVLCLIQCRSVVIFNRCLTSAHSKLLAVFAPLFDTQRHILPKVDVIIGSRLPGYNPSCPWPPVCSPWLQQASLHLGRAVRYRFAIVLTASALFIVRRSSPAYGGVGLAGGRLFQPPAALCQPRPRIGHKAF